MSRCRNALILLLCIPFVAAGSQQNFSVMIYDFFCLLFFSLPYHIYPKYWDTIVPYNAYHKM